MINEVGINSNDLCGGGYLRLIPLILLLVPPTILLVPPGGTKTACVRRPRPHRLCHTIIKNIILP